MISFLVRDLKARKMQPGDTQLAARSDDELPMETPATETDAARTSTSGFAALLMPYLGTLIAIAALSLVGGLAEAGVLVLILEAAILLSGNGRTAPLSIGPMHSLHLSIGTLLAAAVAVTVVRIAAQLAASWRSACLCAKIQRQLRAATFDAYVDADWPIQAAEREGSLQQLLGVEVERTTTAALFVATGLAAGCSFVMLIVSAVVISPVAAVALVGLVLALFFALRPITKISRHWMTARSDDELGVAQSLGELVRTAEEIRVHGVRQPEKRRLAREAENVEGWVRRIHFVGLGVVQVYQGAALLLLIAALFLVDELSVASLAGLGAIVLILLRSFAYSQQLQNTYHQLVATVPSVSRIQQQQALYRARPARSGREALEKIASVDLESVTYSYHPGQQALGGVSLSVGHGEVVGVIGPSGAGKSTLVQVLLRLRSPDTGRYLINGRPADDYDEADWTRLVSYVPQEPKVVTGTVADNIRFLRDGFSDQQVEAAARLANLHTEIETWTAGYDTVIGQRAAAISGGQRQRLCIARALLSSPQLLILDEPTSSLDAESEQIIQQTLESLRGHTTIFIVAHRLSTLSVCGRLLVLANGRVEAFDTSDNLATQVGFYQRVTQILAPGNASRQQTVQAAQEVVHREAAAGDMVES